MVVVSDGIINSQVDAYKQIIYGTAAPQANAAKKPADLPTMTEGAQPPAVNIQGPSSVTGLPLAQLRTVQSGPTQPELANAKPKNVAEEPTVQPQPIQQAGQPQKVVPRPAQTVQAEPSAIAKVPDQSAPIPTQQPLAATAATASGQGQPTPAQAQPHPLAPQVSLSKMLSTNAYRQVAGRSDSKQANATAG